MFKVTGGRREKLLEAYTGGHIRSILAVRTQKIGDMMTFLPTLSALHRLFPEAAITLLCRRAGLDVARRIPYVESVLVDDLKGASPGTAYDLLLTSSQDAAWIRLKQHLKITFAVGILPESLKGVCMKHRWRYHRQYTVADRYSPDEHEVARNLKLVSVFDKVAPHDATLWITQEENASIKFKLHEFRRPLIVVCPSGSRSSRNWSTKNFAALCEQIERDLGGTVVLAGAGNMAAVQSGDILTRCSEEILSLVNKTTFGEFAALIDLADLLISVDSGPVHVSSYLNRPLIALFGPGDFARWRPWHADATRVRSLRVSCRCGSSVIDCREKIHCLDFLTPADVLAEVPRLLQEN